VANSSGGNARVFGFFVVAVIGVWLTVNMLSAWYLSLVSRHWPTTTGHVLASSVDSGTNTLGQWWAPAVTYDYRVGTAKLESARVRFYLPFLRNRDQAEAIRSPYVVGAPVNVSYDPGNPARSVLEPGFRQGIWKPSLIALLFWIMTVALYYEVTHPGALTSKLRTAEKKRDAADQDRPQDRDRAA
jgi:hypothetical protein